MFLGNIRNRVDPGVYNDVISKLHALGLWEFGDIDGISDSDDTSIATLFKELTPPEATGGHS